MFLVIFNDIVNVKKRKKKKKSYRNKILYMKKLNLQHSLEIVC